MPRKAALPRVPEAVVPLELPVGPRARAAESVPLALVLPELWKAQLVSQPLA